MMQSHGPAPPHLRRAYERAVYEADFAHGRLQLQHNQAITAGIPPFAIITAWNPGHERPGLDDNTVANARLEALLGQEGYCYVSARGFDADRTHEEPSFAVVGIELDEALAIARRFGQAAIFWSDGRVGRVVYT